MDNKLTDDEKEFATGFGCLGALVAGVAFASLGGIAAVLTNGFLAATVVGPCAGMLGVLAGGWLGLRKGARIIRAERAKKAQLASPTPTP